MSFLLNWRLWLLVALLALGPICYLIGKTEGTTNGKRTIRLEWTQAVEEANREARKMEQLRQSRADEAGRLAVGRIAGLRRDAARADKLLVRLRSTLDATERNAAQSLNACTATVAAYRAVFESSAAEYRALGEEAAGHASDSLMYQQGWPK